MLKLSVKPGEYVLIGEDIKVVFTGGSSNNLRILVDAPKAYNIVRSEALGRYGMAAGSGNEVKHYTDDGTVNAAGIVAKTQVVAEYGKNEVSSRGSR